MNDDFDARLRSRLQTLDRATPVLSTYPADADRDRTRRRHFVAAVPVGTLAVVAAIVAVVALASMVARPQVLPPGASTGHTTGPASAAPSTAQAGGIVVENVHAGAYPGGIWVTATITNRTGTETALTGLSSPVAKTGGHYATCACTWAPDDPARPTGPLAGKLLMPFERLLPGETIELRSGDGEGILTDLIQPVEAGQTIEVTFIFSNSPPVTVSVVVQ
jgi:copper(I)-binding protein